MKKCSSGLILRICSFGFAMLLAACGGGGAIVPSVGTPDQLPANQSGNLLEGSLPERTRLVTQMPALSTLQAGDEFDYILRGELISELYQLSARLQFDPAVLQPLEAQTGEMVPADAIVLTKLDAPGIVPFAFTALPGHRGADPGRGEILRVRFRLLQRTEGDQRIRLRNDAEFLQLRDRNSRRMSFDLANEVVQP